MPATVIAIANQKGGVGKTTTALSLGGALRLEGRRVLIMDLDPHGNASIHMAFFPEGLTHTAYDLFAGRESCQGLWRRIVHREERSGIDFVPSSIHLSEVEYDTRDREDRGLILSQALDCVREGYDYVLLDCPPHMGVILVNAILAADLLVIPVQTDFLALHGLRLTFDTMRMLGKVLPRKLKYRVLATMYDRRAGACRRVLELMRRKLPGRIFETVIGTDTKFREASARGRTIYDFAPESRGAREYAALAREIEGLS